MRLRKHQGTYQGPVWTKILNADSSETRDGKKSFDPPPHSQAMQKLNKDFARMHGFSSGLNLVALAAIVWYGVVLSERMQ